MRIIFVRHGDPNYAQDCLTPLGHLQAKRVAERLDGEGIVKIYASTCGRALETAGYTAERLGLPYTRLDFMREISWGGEPELYRNGHPWDCADAMRLADDAALFDGTWRNHRYFQTNQVLEFVDSIPTAFDRLLAEQHGVVREGRLYRFMRDVPETIAVFSHGGSSSVVVSHLLSLPFAYFCTMCQPELTSVTVVTLQASAGNCAIPRLEILNDARHLREIDGISDNDAKNLQSHPCKFSAPAI